MPYGRKLGAIEIKVARTKYGPVQLLIDSKTTAVLSIPLPGNTSRTVREDVILEERQERLCIKGSFRRSSVPSADGQGETEILMCCLRRGRIEGGRCKPRAAFVPVVFHHPRDEAASLIAEFESGRLRQRRQAIYGKIRRFGG